MMKYRALVCTYQDLTRASTLQNASLTDYSDSKLQTSKSDDIVDVLIVGAGIGGLIAGLCLHRAGYSVRIHERIQAFDMIGFGINLQPYCVKILYELGLEKELNEAGLHCRTVEFYSSHGQFISRAPTGLNAGFKWPVYSIHRSQLQLLLFRHVRKEIGEMAVRLGEQLVAFRSHSEHIEADFVNTSTGDVNTGIGKVLIGADGINSTVRKILYPDEKNTVANGIAIWRGVTTVEKPFLDGQTMLIIGNPNDRQVVIYPISDQLINWQCTIRVQPTDVRPPLITSDANTFGGIQDVLPFLTDMKLDFLDLHQLISSSTNTNKFMMTDREPLPRWTHDRVTLLGDAAHPMYPFGGNGGSQAIIDARGLVLAFREHGVTPQGLQTYDDLRRTNSSAFVLWARQGGTERFLQVIDERAPSGFQHLSDVISPLELDVMADDIKRMPGWDAQQVNEEPLLF